MRALYLPKFGRGLIHAEPSGLYQPAEDDGDPAVLLGVADRYGGLVDLVAWHHDRPSRWWVRRGVCEILGEAEIDRAFSLNLPLYLFETPDGWLFNHGPGGYWPAACVLDWQVDPRPIFSGIRIVCESQELMARLDEAQRRHDRPLNVTAARPGGGRAAA